jgi:hypothetical protein
MMNRTLTCNFRRFFARQDCKDMISFKETCQKPEGSQACLVSQTFCHFVSAHKFLPTSVALSKEVPLAH